MIFRREEGLNGVVRIVYSFLKKILKLFIMLFYMGVEVFSEI